MRAYLDHAASSPLRPEALAAFVEAAGVTGNASALHTSGRRAAAVLDDARESLVESLGAHPSEIVFTSGGSEADTLAVLGSLAARSERPGVVIGATEHPAVLSVRDRVPGVTEWPVDSDGVVQVGVADGDTAVVSVQTVNNETGTVQPIEAAAEAAHRSGAWFHTDAVQAVGHVAFDFGASPADLASVSAHKLGGPVGVGALLVRRTVELRALGLGGGQERGIRSGTLPVALAAGFAAAAAAARADLDAETARLGGLRRRLVAAASDIPGSRVNGGSRVSPAICHITFDALRADDLLLLLDQQGIDCSTGSACRAGVHQPSEVMLAMGHSVDAALASIRFSFGWSTTDADLDRLLGVLPDAVARARTAFVA